MATVPTAAYQELAQYASASGTATPIDAAKTYLENLSSNVSKTVSNHKLTIGISLAIATALGIGTYYYLKNKKGKR